MTSGMKTIMYPVKDLTTAKQLYGARFGAEPVMDEPYCVGYDVGGQDVGGGKLIATVTDADGNLIGLLQMPAGGWA